MAGGGWLLNLEAHGRQLRALEGGAEVVEAGVVLPALPPPPWREAALIGSSHGDMA